MKSISRKFLWNWFHGNLYEIKNYNIIITCTVKSKPTKLPFVEHISLQGHCYQFSRKKSFPNLALCWFHNLAEMKLKKCKKKIRKLLSFSSAIFTWKIGKILIQYLKKRSRPMQKLSQLWISREQPDHWAKWWKQIGGPWGHFQHLKRNNKKMI